jgi:hypothetical protein
VKRDLQVLGVRRWTELVIDRDKIERYFSTDLERMEEDKKNKKIFTQEMEGTRRRGRPRKGWREEVERDAKVPE